MDAYRVHMRIHKVKGRPCTCTPETPYISSWEVGATRGWIYDYPYFYSWDWLWGMLLQSLRRLLLGPPRNATKKGFKVQGLRFRV